MATLPQVEILITILGPLACWNLTPVETRAPGSTHICADRFPVPQQIIHFEGEMVPDAGIAWKPAHSRSCDHRKGL